MMVMVGHEPGARARENGCRGPCHIDLEAEFGRWPSLAGASGRCDGPEGPSYGIRIYETNHSAAAENDSRFAFRRFHLLCAYVLHLCVS
jgi:hypothetical protein